MGAVFVRFDKKPSKEAMIEAWANFKGRAQELELPSAPKQFLHYFEEDNCFQKCGNSGLVFQNSMLHIGLTYSVLLGQCCCNCYGSSMP
jgi:hypothetical protein